MHYAISWMCQLPGVPRSSFYAWRNRAETATAARRRAVRPYGYLNKSGTETTS